MKRNVTTPGSQQRRQRPESQARAGGAPRARARRRSARPAFEVLEDRVALATFLVVNALDGPGSGPAGSLRSAITQATQAGGMNRVVITSAVTSPIDLTAGEVEIPASVLIDNQAGHELVIHQATADSRVFDIGADATQVTITGRRQAPITLAGGSLSTGNGAGILASGTTNLTLSFVRIASNTAAAGSGGGIYVNAGNVNLVSSSVAQNAAPGGFGGGIYVVQGAVVLTNGSHVDGNSALNIGGIGVKSGPSVLRDAVRLLNGSSASGNSSTSTVDPAAGNFGGGGVAVQGAGGVFVSQSQVSDNHTNGMYSGGILVTAGSVRVTNRSQVDRNSNQGPGGGIAANFLGSVTVTGHSEVNDNIGAALGGGIVNFGSRVQTVTIDRGSEVRDNTLTNAESLGQALIVFLKLIATSIGSDFQSLTGLTVQQGMDVLSQSQAEVASAHGVDTATLTGRLVAGGGIGTLLGARVQIQRSSGVDHNLAGSQATNVVPFGVGGGVAVFLGGVLINGGTVNDNTATADGGGIWARNDVRVVQGTLAHNTARGLTLPALGGGLFLGFPSQSSLIRNSTVRDNAAAFGGGVFNLGTLSVQNSLISQNQAAQKGGGFRNFGQLILLNTTVTRNTAGLSGGGISGPGALTTRHSRIVANVPDNISGS